METTNVIVIGSSQCRIPHWRGYAIFAEEKGGEDVFFNFTAISGEGYRTLIAGTPIPFELLEGKFGRIALNVQKQDTQE